MDTPNLNEAVADRGKIAAYVSRRKRRTASNNSKLQSESSSSNVEPETEDDKQLKDNESNSSFDSSLSISLPLENCDKKPVKISNEDIQSIILNKSSDTSISENINIDVSETSENSGIIDINDPMQPLEGSDHGSDIERDRSLGSLEIDNAHVTKNSVNVKEREEFESDNVLDKDEHLETEGTSYTVDLSVADTSNVSKMEENTENKIREHGKFSLDSNPDIQFNLDLVQDTEPNVHNSTKNSIGSVDTLEKSWNGVDILENVSKLNSVNNELPCNDSIIINDNKISLTDLQNLSKNKNSSATYGSLDFEVMRSSIDSFPTNLNFQPNSLNLISEHNLSDVNYAGKRNTSPVNEASIDLTKSWATKLEDLQLKHRSIDPMNNTDPLSGRDTTLIESLVDSVSIPTSSTEYKTLCEEYAERIIEFQTAIVYRDQMIEKLSESLEMSMKVREQTNVQCEELTKEVDGLRKQLEETAVLLNKQIAAKERGSPEIEEVQPKTAETCVPVNEAGVVQLSHITNMLATNELQKFENSLHPIQKLEFSDIKFQFKLLMNQESDEMKQKFDNDLKKTKENFEQEKQDLENEVSKLRQALCDFQESGMDIMQIKEHLQLEHKKEMENLRTYFEGKCADLEKNYSEEIFSQQSRRMSNGSSTDCDVGVDLLYSPRQQKQDEEIIEEFVQTNANGSIIDESIGGGGDSLNILFPPEMPMHSINQNTELLQQQYEDKINNINKEHEIQLEQVKEKYDTEISRLKKQYEHYEERSENKTTGSEANEIALQEVLEESERRLQEQVQLARRDILSTIEEQIQAIINDENMDESSLPTEFVKLKDILTSRSQNEIEQLKISHKEEISRLKNSYDKQLDRRMRRNSSFDSNRDADSIVKERDGLRRMTQSLRSLLTELASYFNNCETELNNTLCEVLNRVKEFPDNQSNISEESEPCGSLNSTQMSVEPGSVTTSHRRRVHFAPDMSGLMTLIGNDSLLDYIDLNKDVSIDLRNELDSCLDRLRSEAAALLGLTQTRTVLDPKHHGVNSEEELIVNHESLHAEVIKAEIAELLTKQDSEKQSLISELAEISQERDSLQLELSNTKEKLCEVLAVQRREVVNEGYGEQIITSSSSKSVNPQDLRDRVTCVLNTPNTDANAAPLLQLIEELSRDGDRMSEESKRDKIDLQKQVALDKHPIIQRNFCQKVEVADAKLRSTRQFLDEQAVEREQEINDFTKEINSLKEIIKERDREKQGYERVVKEQLEELRSKNRVSDIEINSTILKTVEQLELQMREMNVKISENEKLLQTSEAEKKAAVDKIWDLREIITELESQIESKILNEESLNKQLIDLTQLVEQQNKNNEILGRELDSMKSEGDVRQLTEKVNNLEEQLNSHRISTENPDVVLQIRDELNQIESSVDNKTRLLESLHAAVCSTSCSSEDVSMRDHQQQNMEGRSWQEGASTPLEHIARVREKLQRHSKAEDAALKRIRDLEMQITGVKNSYGELQSERDILQERLQEQLVRISSLQSRLDEQRRRADSLHKQSTSDLHIQIHDLQSELTSAKEILEVKNKRIVNLERLVEQSRIRIAESEGELLNQTEREDIKQLNVELSQLKIENKQLKDKVKTQMINKMALPDLMDTMLEEKNEEIDQLREQLDKKDKDLEVFKSLNLDDEQVKQLQIQAKETADGKLSARTLSDILSISEYDEPDIMRKAETKMHSMDLSLKLPKDVNTPEEIQYIRSENNTVSSVGPLKLLEPFNNKSKNVSSLPTPHLDVSSMLPRKLNFSSLPPNCSSHLMQDKVDLLPENDESSISESINVSQLQKEVTKLHGELEEKSALVKEYENQLSEIPGLQVEIEELRTTLQTTIEAVDQDKEFYKTQFETMSETEKKLRVDVKDLDEELTQKRNEIVRLQDEINSRDNLILSVNKQKMELEAKISEMESKLAEHVNNEALVNEKQSEIDKLKELIEKLESEVYDTNQEIQDLRQTLSDKNAQVLSNLKNIEGYEQTIRNQKSLIESSNEIANKQLATNSLLDSEVKLLQEQLKQKTQHHSLINEKQMELIQNKQSELKAMKDKLADKECEIEILNEDMKYFHEEITILKNKLADVTPAAMISLQEEQSKNLIELQKLTDVNSKLNNEILHLKDHLLEKDKVINQMSIDSSSLHSALATIQTKLQETGNVLDLKKKLNESRNIIEEQGLEIQQLRGDDGQVETSPRPFSLENLACQADKELELSVQLDNSILNAIESDEMYSDEDAPDQMRNENDKLKSDNQMLNKRLEIEMKRFVELTTVKETLLLDLQSAQEKLEQEVETSKRLQLLLDNEKRSSYAIQMQDADIMEKLRKRMEIALKNEADLRQQLQAEKRDHDNSDAQLEILQLQLHGKTPSLETTPRRKHSLASNESTSYKKELELQLESNERLNSEILLLTAQIDREKDRFLDLQNIVDKEKLRFQKEIKDRTQLTDKLKTEMNKISEQKNKLVNELTTAHDKISVQQLEISQLAERMQALQAAELRRSQRKDRERLDLQSKASRLEEIQKKNVQTEMRLQTVQDDLRKAMQRESVLQDALHKERQDSLNQAVPEEFLNKLQEMSTMLSEHVIENKQMAAMLAELKNGQGAASPYASNREVEERSNHVFGKYLRCESYRKALVWQKKYLLVVIKSYKDAEDKALRHLGVGKSPVVLTPKRKFRMAVFTIISIHRMQFLVRKWHAGKMIGARATIGASQHLPRRSASVSNNVWAIPQSPPCRDKESMYRPSTGSRQNYQEYRDRRRDTLGLFGASLQSPVIAPVSTYIGIPGTSSSNPNFT